MFLSILQMALPVLCAFGLGYVCKRKQIINDEGHRGLKAVVSKVTLPAVLFYAFLTAEYSGKIALMFVTVFIACGLGLLAGFLLRRFVKPYGRFFPFLVTNFEGGMLGYALFGLLYVGQIHIFVMVDIGQTFFSFTVFLATLRAVGGQKTSLKAMGLDMARNVVFIGIVLGALLGMLGVGQWVQSTQIGAIITDVLQFIIAPTGMLILLIVGYELRFDKALVAPVLKTVGLRLLVMVPIMALSALVVFSIIPFEKPLFTAMLLAAVLPAPFITPIFANAPGEENYISTAISIQTLVTLMLFVGVAAYTLAG